VDGIEKSAKKGERQRWQCYLRMAEQSDPCQFLIRLLGRHKLAVT